MARAAPAAEDPRLAPRRRDSGRSRRSRRRWAAASTCGSPSTRTRRPTIRLQVTFLPQANGAIVVCYSLTSLSGRRHRHRDRQPLHSLRRVLSGELAGRPPALVPFAAAAPRPAPGPAGRLRRACVAFAADRWRPQRHAARARPAEHGAGIPASPHQEREDLGKITQEGRYRVWKEIWMLNYLGRSAPQVAAGAFYESLRLPLTRAAIAGRKLRAPSAKLRAAGPHLSATSSGGYRQIFPADNPRAGRRRRGSRFRGRPGTPRLRTPGSRDWS